MLDKRHVYLEVGVYYVGELQLKPISVFSDYDFVILRDIVTVIKPLPLKGISAGFGKRRELDSFSILFVEIF